MGDPIAMRRTAEPDTAEPVTAKTLDLATAKTLEIAEPNTSEPNANELDTRTTLDTADVHCEHRGELTRASTTSYLPRSTRRTVVERDGLGCSRVDEHGVRCGGSEPDNLRLLCRSHNRWAAGREYGRRRVQQTIAERRRERAPHEPAPSASWAPAI